MKKEGICNGSTAKLRTDFWEAKEGTWFLNFMNGSENMYLLEGLVEAVYKGTAVIEDELNHPFIAMDPIAKELCRVRYGRVSIFIKKAEVMKVYGKLDL